MTRYTTLEAAQRAADRSAQHISMAREYLEWRVRTLEQERDRAESRLEEAQAALGAFNGKGAMAEKIAS